WSNQHVRESVTAMKQKRAGDFPALTPLQRFADLG
ncbi:MAG TPA: enoyl-CoA hydratase, partial [Acidovorax temperans]|nr:enoyl-CoA hydratase [Acidovorax temperans]